MELVCGEGISTGEGPAELMTRVVLDVVPPTCAIFFRSLQNDEYC
jgi:hypothetical protein